MSWINKLYETYLNCESEVGKIVGTAPVLLPLEHTTQQAQIEIVLDGEGNWLPGRARVLSKEESTTTIPCTEDSAGRTSKPVPHPLFDKLQYIAGDYRDFVTLKKKDTSYEEYIQQLEGWCSSPFAHLKVCAVLTYLKKGTLIHDLVAEKILFCDEAGLLMEKWKGEKNAIPPIFKAVSGSPSSAFVRMRVEMAGDPQSRLWTDKEVWNSFIDYQKSLTKNSEYCYVLGEKLPTADKNPSKIRNSGDKAKLISGNDSSGFTYRGRFQTSGQAVSIGSSTSQMAHNALKWLIQKQGYRNGDQVILAWGTKDEKMLPLCGDSVDIALSFFPSEPLIDTRQEFASRFNQAISGYGKELDDCADVVVLGLDSATPGRLSITYYRELQGSEFLARIRSWHTSCTWLLEKNIPDAENKKKTRWISFYGAPSPSDIALAAHGSRVKEELKKSVVERLLPCIVDQAKLPYDLVQCAVRRASNPVGMENWEARKTLGVACALIRKYHNDRLQKEEYRMELQVDKKERDYLWGRALAYAQNIESYALRAAGEKRTTNAERLQYEFSMHPAKTWMNLYHKLLPYLQRLGDKANNLKIGLNEVVSQISPENFNNAPLSEIYLLGYATQMNVFYEEMRKHVKNNTDSETID